MQEKPFVAICKIEESKTSGITPMLQDEIRGTYPAYISLQAGEKVSIDESCRQLLLFLIQGSVDFIQNDSTPLTFAERVVYIPDPQIRTEIQANSDSFLFMLSWDVSEEDRCLLKNKPIRYPYIQYYRNCPQYTEPFKSAKTISRTIVPHNLLPRFSMGSNEAGENDRVEMNNHPHIDQYFFSFPENDVFLLIENKKIHFTGNTFLHVPLGCNHGVEIGSGQKMHYIWIDFIIDAEGIKYLDTVHQPIQSNNQVERKEKI